MLRHIETGKSPVDPGAARSEVEAYLRDVALANRWLGGTAVVMRHLPRLIGDKPAHQPVRILDLATGGADIPIALVEWARARGIAVRITAIDNDEQVVEAAKRRVEAYPEVSIELRDARLLPYPPHSFDFVVCSQIMHHLDRYEALGVLRAARTIASQGIVVSDLHRRPLCLALGWAGSRLIRNPLSREDARISFESAYTVEELEDLADTVPLPCWEIYRHGPCRLALVADMRCAIPTEAPTRACQSPAAG